MEYTVRQSEPQEILSQKFQPWIIIGAVLIVCLVFGIGFLFGVLFERDATTNTDEEATHQQNVAIQPVSQDSAARPSQVTATNKLPNEGAEYALVCLGMSNAHQECADWLEKINGPLQNNINPKLKVINCAVGSHAIERWNDDSFNAVLWDACAANVRDAGLTPADVKYVWHKPMVQFVRDEHNNLLPPYPALNSGYYNLLRELDIFATRLPQFMPAVEVVFMSGRSYGGFSTRPDRGEPLAKLSNQAIEEWIQNNQVVDGVRYVVGPYLWAPDCANRTDAELLCYVRNDYQRDGIHPATGALNKITRVLHDYFSQYEWYAR